MVNLKEIPYCLSDEDIAWVERTIGEMSDEEKVGQLFFDNRGMAPEELIELVTKYHIGGYRYNGILAARVQEQVRILQTNAKIPLFVACNTEEGGMVLVQMAHILQKVSKLAQRTMKNMRMRWDG